MAKSLIFANLYDNSKNPEYENKIKNIVAIEISWNTKIFIIEY